jgi:hypothetical protein
MLKRCPHFSKETSVKPAVLGLKFLSILKQKQHHNRFYNPRRLFKAGQEKNTNDRLEIKAL